MNLTWPSLTVGDWHRLLSQSESANWMQSWPYAQASYKCDQRIPKVAVINKDNQEIGIAVFQEIKLGPVHVIELKRGPLWFEGVNTPENFLEFAALFERTFPRRLLRWRRWLPEMPSSELLKGQLRDLGFVERPETYETMFLDLKKGEGELRAELKQKWRNGLNKAERSGVEVTVDWKCEFLDLFLAQYDIHKSLKSYRGVTSRFLKEEVHSALKVRGCFLVWALDKGVPVAGALIGVHGLTGSYRVSWNTEQGRKLNAHYAILWRTLCELKSINAKHFDLGGLKSDEAPGLSHFKKGLGGEYRQFIGMWS